MDKLIPVVNKLQDLFAELGVSSNIELPQIAVVGSQSAGKSSVLENIVGKDFLPRGSGIVTRRPLILQLINTPTEQPYAEFLHLKGRQITDFGQVRIEIQRVTDSEAPGKAISKKPINLKVYSKDVLNLTLVDLPGLTKVAVEDQPKDIDMQIKEMVKGVISQQSCVILAVSAANQDIANSDALALAKEVDPAGDRTLGVLTKIDIMDQGTDCVDILTGKTFPLKMGFIGVVNRSQKDINNNKDILESLKAERAFFENNTAYAHLASRMGTQYLAKTLNQILLQHIRTRFPELKSRITEMMLQTRTKMKQLGVGEDDVSGGALLLRILNRYATAVSGVIEGTSARLKKSEIDGGARINYIFYQGFAPALQTIQADDFSDEEIRTIIENAKGTRASLFIPDESFAILVRHMVSKLREPCMNCCDRILEELLRICGYCEKVELGRFPNLKERVNGFVRKLLMDYASPLKLYIGQTIDSDEAYINTNHPHFYGGGAVFDKLMDEQVQTQQAKRDAEIAQQQQQAAEAQQAQQQLQQGPPSGGRGARAGPPPSHQPPHQMAPPPGPPQYEQAGHHNPAMGIGMNVPGTIHCNITTDRQRQEVDVIKKLLTTYFNIIRINYQDRIPKVIVFFLVDKLKDNMQNELVAEFYKENLLNELLTESEEAARRRKATLDMMKALEQANAQLSDISGFRL